MSLHRPASLERSLFGARVPQAGGPKMNPDQTYRAKFYINGQDCSLDCKADERFEVIKDRIWKTLKITGEKKDAYVFKLRKFERFFKDFETFARLVAVFQEDEDSKIEALLVKKDQIDPAAAQLDVRVKDDGSVPIQGYMDRVSHLGENPNLERRYFVLKNTTLYYYASESAFYQKEQAVGSIELTNSQAVPVPDLKWTFQLIRMEDGGLTGKFVVRAENELAFKLWLHHLRRMNYELSKLRGLSSSVWVPDKSVANCMRCEQKFSLTRRKHHCRTCGAVVCAECSKDKITLADNGESVRVCKHCYQDYKREKKSKQQQDAKKAVGLQVEEEELEEKKNPRDVYKELRDQVRSSIKLTATVEGYLMKQSARGLKPWQKRWCVLDERARKIIYYKDKKHRLLGQIGEIKLANVVSCFHVKDDRIRFDVVTNLKSYSFEAPSPALSSRWVTHINRLLREAPRDSESSVNSVSSVSSSAGSPAVAPVRRLKGAEPTEQEKVKAVLKLPKIFMEGPLKKMSPKSNRFFVTWQERWFILNQEKNHIIYFRRSPKAFPEEKELGSIPLQSIAMCKYAETKIKFCIWVNTGRQYTLLCRSEAEASNWVNNITKCISVFDDGKKALKTSPASSLAGSLPPLSPRGVSISSVNPGSPTHLGSSGSSGSLASPDSRRPTQLMDASGYVEADDGDDDEVIAEDDDDDIPPPPPPPPGGFEDSLPPEEVGWPQLRTLEPASLVPIIIRILSFLPQRDLLSTIQVSQFWKVVTEELLKGDDEEDVEEVEEDDEEGDMDGLGMNPRKDVKAIIIDNGTCYIRAGFIGDRQPRVIIPQRSASVMDMSEKKGEGVSLDAMNHFMDNKPTWRAMRKCWQEIFEKLDVDPSDYKVLITQPLLSPTYVKERYFEILFKKFKVQGVFVAESPVLTAYSYGKYTALVIDIGNTSVQVCPIVEGYMKEDAIRRAPYLGGEASTQRMLEFLKYTSISKMDIWEAFQIAQQIKEKYCFVATDYTTAVADPKHKVKYSLPNGEELTIQKALPAIGEMYFDPRKVIGDKDERFQSVQGLVQDAMDVSEMDTRRELFENILVSGGESMMPGFVERLDLELKKFFPHAAGFLRVHADKDRSSCVFSGAAILAGLDMFQKKWVMQWDWVADQQVAAARASASAAASPARPLSSPKKR